MATGNSNTYVLPSQGSSIAVSRTQFNSSLRAVLQNFYSTGAPGTDNLIDSGSAMGESDYDGMLFRNSTTGMLYISDSAISNPIRTNNPVGGKFTRYGIAWRQQASLAAAAANIATFDLGEAFVVLGPEVSAANNRIYLRVGLSTVFENDFVDLGKPAPGQVDATALSNYSISGVILANVLARPTTVTITPRAAFDSIANLQNSAATAAIEVKGSAVDNVCIGFTTATNSSIIKQVYSNAGISIESTNGNLAPIRSNVFLQATVTGSTSSQSVAPLIPAGVIVAWAGSSAPDGWLICDGAEISRTTYAALWAICSTTFGSTSASTFNIPDIRGRTVYGTSASIAYGTKTASGVGSGFSSGSGTTGAGGAHTHTTTTASINSTSDKDVAATVTVLTGISAAADHTHSATGALPGISLNYIIKT